MSTATIIVFAHHALVVALPFVVPVLALVIGALVFTVRERRRRSEEASPVSSRRVG